MFTERLLEDHENLVESMLQWTRTTNNKLMFVEREDKYDLFKNPERYLLSCASSEKGAQLEYDAKNTLLEEFFAPTTGSFFGVPEVEGNLYLKTDSKKAWKKHFCVLRASGLYYCLKGVKSKSSKDLICLTTFDSNHIFNGIGWKKKYKAPTDFGFALKPLHIQTKSSKYIKYLCAESERECKLWIQGIRIVKYGRNLKENFETITRDIAEDDLESLAAARSCSVSSFAKPNPASTTTIDTASKSRENSITSSSLNNNNNHNCNSSNSDLVSWSRINRKDSIRSSSTSSSSSGKSNSSTPTLADNYQGMAFEADFPTGTIKRKPSLQPKLPLTSTTRSLAKQSDVALLEIESPTSSDDEKNQVKCDTLRLRNSSTDERVKNMIYESCYFRYNEEERLNTKGARQETEEDADCEEEDDGDEVELPLPPPPETLSNSLSFLSLNSLPPPPQEYLHNTSPSVTKPPTSSVIDKASTVNSVQKNLVKTCDTPVNLAQSNNKSALCLSKKEPIDKSSYPQPSAMPLTIINHSSNQINPDNNLTTHTLPRVKTNASYNSLCPNSLKSPMRGPLPPPPEVFLRDLHRVMDKKWQVAQKLSADTSKTVNQILGFRDHSMSEAVPQLANTETLRSNKTAKLANNITTVPTSPLYTVNYPVPPPPALRCTSIYQKPVSSHKKPPPPPPPKRSDKTQLSSRN